MKWFLLKKSFFDSVDNFLGFIICNLFSAIPIVGLYFFVKVNPEGFKPGMLVVAFILFVLASIISFGINCISFAWGNYRKSWLNEIKGNYKEHKGHCFLFVLMCVFILLSIAVCIPFYLNSLSYLGIFLAFFMVWLIIIVLVGLIYFCPLMKYFPNEKPGKTFVHSISLAFRNAGFTFFVLICTLVQFVVSVFTCSIIPGIAGMGLFQADAVRLLLLREKYMLDNNVSKRKIDYSEFLFDEKENLGKRSIKHFFKPWKLD